MESILLIAVKYRNYEYALAEMISLIETLDAHVDMTVTMHKDLVSNASYLGKGKIEEVRLILEKFQIETMVINDNISPAQKRALEESLKVKVLDRTEIILAIFSSRAISMEAKIQVEMAQLRYLMPRLTRMWTHLSRQKGGIGMKGVGETQLETDRRVCVSGLPNYEKILMMFERVVMSNVNSVYEVVFLLWPWWGIRMQGNRVCLTPLMGNQF